MRRRWKACTSAPMPGHGWRTVSPMSSTTGRPDLGGTRSPSPRSMAMLMGNRPLGPGTLGLRAMVSLDPTMGKSGYPLLFQTGETADGKDASRRSTAPPRLLHGAGDFLQRAARQRGIGVRLCRPSRRARARPLGVHAPLLGHAQPGGPADAPLARLHAHHLRRRDARREPGSVPAGGLLVQWSRARSIPLEHRDAQVRLLVDAPLVQSDARSCPCRSATAT